MSGTTNRQVWEKILSDQKAMQDFRSFHWEGGFFEYLDLVKKNPSITRNAFQRMYDLIQSFGTTSYVEYKKNIIRYKFFDDPIDSGKDAVFGLDVPLMKLVHFFKSAAYGYGTEKRVLLLHGPVGSAKSTIARLIKKGVEWYSKTDAGALYTFKWVDEEGKFGDIMGNQRELRSPMHEEPLKLVPEDIRSSLLEEINRGNKGEYKVTIKGDLDPASRYIYREFMRRYNGDWVKMVQNHIRVERLILLEKDRVGIGTFQP